MGSTLSKGSLFPATLVNEMVNLVRGKSSLARLSASEPLPFNGETIFTFNFDNEVNLVGENGAKANGGATIAAVTTNPVKVEYGMRVSEARKYSCSTSGLSQRVLLARLQEVSTSWRCTA